MKKKIFLIFLIAAVATTLIYFMFKNDELTYLALGDFVAKGSTPSGSISYSYNDYVTKKLSNEKKLRKYYDNFVGDDVRTNDLIKMIKDNKKGKNSKKEITIQQALVKSDIITLSIGSYDLYNHLGITNGGKKALDSHELNNYFISMFTDLYELITLIQKYTPGKIVVIGFYSPILETDNDLTETFKHIDTAYRKIVEKKGCYYISINEEISSNPKYFDTEGIQINKNAQNYIGEQIIKELHF